MVGVLDVVLVLGFLQVGLSDREHKVHNIVLYPERNSWCQTTPIKQIVASTGFEPTTIDNNVCVGACFSYSIPRTQPAEPGELIGPYCDSCQPSETMCYHVTLHATDKNSDLPKTIKKRVEIITNCSCMSCEKGQNKDCDITDQNTSELPTDLFSWLRPNASKSSSEEIQQPTQEVPELMHINSRNRTTYNFNDTNIPEHNLKLVNLLKSIQDDGEDTEEETNFTYDRRELNAILEVIEKYKSEFNHTNLLELVSFVNIHNSEGLQLDLSRLKDVIFAFKKEKDLIEKHRAFGLGLKNNEQIERDAEDLAKKYDLPENFWIERNHIGMGLTKNPGHHYVGERQQVGFDAGHLALGPHGSLVLSPDSKIREKIHLDSEMLTPNQEGVVMSYQNHPKSHQLTDD